MIVRRKRCSALESASESTSTRADKPSLITSRAGGRSLFVSNRMHGKLTRTGRAAWSILLRARARHWLFGLGQFWSGFDRTRTAMNGIQKAHLLSGSCGSRLSKRSQQTPKMHFEPRWNPCDFPGVWSHGQAIVAQASKQSNSSNCQRR